MNSQDSKTAIDKLKGAQETLLIPLWARAVEASRPEPILYDAKAVEVIASLDYDFSKFDPGGGAQTSCCLRAAIIDGWVRQFLQQHPDGTVVEIGAGLDTRFERVDNGRVRWFDLDLPEAMEVRRCFFTESDRRTFLAQSALEPDWIEVVRRASAGPAASRDASRSTAASSCGTAASAPILAPATPRSATLKAPLIPR